MHVCSLVDSDSKTSRQTVPRNTPKLSSRVPTPGSNRNAGGVCAGDGVAVGAAAVGVGVEVRVVVGTGEGVAVGVADAGETVGVGVVVVVVVVGVTGTGEGVAVAVAVAVGVATGVGVGDGACVGAGIGLGDGAGATRVAVGAACVVAPPVASGAATGDGLCSATARVVGGGVSTAGSDSMGPHVAPKATSIRHARAARRHHARICSHPPEPAPGRPRILGQGAVASGRACRAHARREAARTRTAIPQPRSTPTADAV